VPIADGTMRELTGTLILWLESLGGLTLGQISEHSRPKCVASGPRGGDHADLDARADVYVRRRTVSPRRTSDDGSGRAHWCAPQSREDSARLEFCRTPHTTGGRPIQRLNAAASSYSSVSRTLCARTCINDGLQRRISVAPLSDVRRSSRAGDRLPYANGRRRVGGASRMTLRVVANGRPSHQASR
jgi:hypothetical protein